MIGERGKEAVVPLENNTGWMDILAEKLSARLNVTLAGAGGGDIYLDVYIGNEAIDDRIVKVQRKRDIRSNGKGTI
jgi:hypothetical protein